MGNTITIHTQSKHDRNNTNHDSDSDDEDTFHIAIVNNQLFYTGDICEEGAHQFQIKAHTILNNNKGRKGIVIHLTSTGGDIHAGLAMMTTVEEIGTQIETICICKGEVSSAATFPAFACHKRYAGYGTDFLIHPAKTYNFGGGKSEKFEREVKELNDTNDKIVKQYMRFSKNPDTIDKIKEIIKTEYISTVEDMIELGLIDDVWPLGSQHN